MKKREQYRQIKTWVNYPEECEGAILNPNVKSTVPYRGYDVLMGNVKQVDRQGFYVDILDALIDHLTLERLRFNNLFIGRFDITYPFDNQPSVQQQKLMMEKFNRKLSTYLARETVKKNNALRDHLPVKIGYVHEYGRKQKRESKEITGWHYHAYLCLDADKVDRWWDDNEHIDLFTLVDNIWKKVSGEYYKEVFVWPDSCRNWRRNHWVIPQGESGNEKFNTAIKWLSYLTKIRSKERKTTDKHYVKGRKVYSISGYPLVERFANTDSGTWVTHLYRFSCGYSLDRKGNRVTEYAYYCPKNDIVF